MPLARFSLSALPENIMNSHEKIDKFRSRKIITGKSQKDKLTFRHGHSMNVSTISLNKFQNKERLRLFSKALF